MWRFDNNAGDGEATRYAKQPPTPQGKPSNGTPRERERGAGHETPGVATLRPTPRRWAALGHSGRDSPRTETVGEM